MRPVEVSPIFEVAVEGNQVVFYTCIEKLLAEHEEYEHSLTIPADEESTYKDAYYI